MRGQAMVEQPGLGMEPWVELCLDRARACECLAAKAGDPRSRELYLSVASRWRSLAAPDEVAARIDPVFAPADPRSPVEVAE